MESLPYDDPPVERRWLDLVRPEGAGLPYALCFVHGGGWRAGDRAQWHRQQRAAAARGITSASLGYRVGGRLPELMDDVGRGYRLLLDLLPDGMPVFLVGSSAGAHLAVLLALTEERRPAGCVSLNGPGAWLRPWPGMDPQIRAAVEHLTAGDYATASPAHHLSGGDQTAASPAHHVATGNPPPMLFVVVGKERYFPHEHVRELSALLPGSRVVLLPDAEHGFFYDPDSGESAAAQAEIDAFIAAAPPG